MYAHDASFFPCLLVHRRRITDWTHVAVIVTGNKPAVFINGVLAEEGLEASRTLHLYQSTLGGRGDGDSLYSGALDELRLYSRALPAADVRLIFDSERNRNRCFQAESLSVPGWYFNAEGYLVKGATNTFRTVAGLAGTGTVTFESCDEPGTFFRHR